MATMAFTKRAFGSHPDDVPGLALGKRMGFDANTMKALASAGLSWVQILALLVEFGAQYGVQIVAIVEAIIQAFGQTGPAAIVQALGNIVTQYGPGIYAMIQMVASWFGLAVPPLPSLTLTTASSRSKP